MTTAHQPGTSLPPVLGIPLPLPSGLDQPFFDGLKAHQIVLQRCADCAGWQWPPEVLCHRCRSFDMRWEQVAETTGTIFTWSRVWHAAREGLEASVPYVVVVVELAQAGGFRLVGNLLGDPEAEVRVGQRVTAQFEDHTAGDETYVLLQWRAV